MSVVIELVIAIFIAFMIIAIVFAGVFFEDIPKLLKYLKNTVKPPIGYQPYKTLLRCKDISYRQVNWAHREYMRQPIYLTIGKFDFVLDLYKKKPEIYGVLMYKYGDTFNLIEIVLNDAKEKGLLDDLVLLKNVRDMMDYPIQDFKELEKMLAQTDSVKRQQELEVLYRNLAGEMDILKDLRKFNE